jgi:hypothetical protein
VRSQAAREAQTLDIAVVVLSAAAWLVVVGLAAVAGAILDDFNSRRVMPTIAFFGFWPTVIAWRLAAGQRRRSSQIR